MVKKLDKILEEIKKYCVLNRIEDVEDFVAKCTNDGFNIAKYGFSPFDNMSRENETDGEDKFQVSIKSAKLDRDGKLLFLITKSNGEDVEIRMNPTDLPDLPLKKTRKLKEKING